MFIQIYYDLQKRYKQIADDYNKKWYFTIQIVANVHKIQRRVLFNKIHEKNDKFTRETFNKRFNIEQKQILLIYIQRLNDMNMSLIFKFIMNVVDYFIFKQDFKTKFVSDNWYTRFKKRNFQLKLRRQKFIIIDRKNVFDEKNLTRYFIKLNNVLRYYIVNNKSRSRQLDMWMTFATVKLEFSKAWSRWLDLVFNNW